MFDQVQVDQMIPEVFYRAVVEIIALLNTRGKTRRLI
jgi:flagellar biosynthesis protein FlhB